jgi:hypothetical protein
MDTRLHTYLTRIFSGVLLLAGVVVVLVGYIGVRGESSVELQLPYIASGGIGGLALIGLGVAGLLWAGAKEQAAQVAEVVDSLEQWKDAALTQLREFLESADVELQVVQPTTLAQVPARRRAPRSA